MHRKVPPQLSEHTSGPFRPFKLITTDRAWLGGVSGGLAYFIGFPTWLVRLAWFLAIFCAGIGLGLYVLLWIFAPRWRAEPLDYAVRCSEEDAEEDVEG